MPIFVEFTNPDNNLPVLVNLDLVTDIRPMQPSVTVIALNFLTPRGEQFTIEIAEPIATVRNILAEAEALAREKTLKGE